MKTLASYDRYRVGLAGLGALGLLAGLVVAGSTLQIGANTYTADLEHTGGLRVGEEVQVAGVGAGEVTGIELGEKSVKVTFTVDDDIELGSKSKAEVKVATLLGTHLLQVTPLGGGELADSRIPLAQTRVPFNLQDALDGTVDEVGQLDAVKVEQALGQLADTLDASGDELGPALDGVRALSGLVATRSDELGQLLTAASDVADQLNRSGADIVGLMKQADIILDALRTRRATIHALLGDLSELGTQLTGVIDDTKGDLGPTLKNLDDVIALLKKHDAALDKAVETLAPTARYFANAGGTGSWLDLNAPGAIPDNLSCQTGGC